MSDSHPIALVTGGSRGLGRSTVLSLAGRGVDSIFTYLSNKEAADEVVRLAAEAGACAIALRLDTSDATSFPAFVPEVEAALAALGSDRLDYLVNNAGTGHHNAIAETTAAELDAVYNVHFKGVFLLTQALLPLLRDGGRIGGHNLPSFPFIVCAFIVLYAAWHIFAVLRPRARECTATATRRRARAHYHRALSSLVSAPAVACRPTTLRLTTTLRKRAMWRQRGAVKP